MHVAFWQKFAPQIAIPYSEMWQAAIGEERLCKPAKNSFNYVSLQAENFILSFLIMM